MVFLLNIRRVEKLFPRNWSPNEYQVLSEFNMGIYHGP